MAKSKHALAMAIAGVLRESRAAGFSDQEIFSEGVMELGKDPSFSGPPAVNRGLGVESDLTDRGGLADNPSAKLQAAEAFVRSLGKEPSDVAIAMQSADTADFVRRKAAQKGAGA